MRHLPWIGALGLLLLASDCKRKVPLAEHMTGNWKASVEHGGRLSKDPIVRGWTKFWGGGKFDILLDIGPGSIEVRRPTHAAEGIEVQRASFTPVADDRIELTTSAGKALIRVRPDACDKKGEHCLSISFEPDASAPPAALDAMGFLFGCDDVSGKVSCNGVSTQRVFYRYVPSPAASE